MIIRLLSAALVAGFLAAVAATGLQLALTSPLIVAAEAYEGQSAALSAPKSLVVLAHSHGNGAEGHDPSDPGHAGHDHGGGEWQPGEGLPRMAFTGLATLIGGVGYALLLGAVMLALRLPPGPETGLKLGLAGFAAVALAPAVGLPPELPGMGAADLELRQAWWLMTVIATGLGLYLILVRRVPITILGGLVLIVGPHLAGAPHVEEAASNLPAGYAAQFAARSLAIAFVFWALIGLGFGWAWHAFGREKATARA
ncbi:CbtA family protein [Methylobacterium organophilum]|uniref:Cobalt transporter n=1 Tax=Methylobacterium organophilum TaxID=410 RepID=A0ABQ4T3S0_METOR|nr:CbtA family protein [Methylobacterium organophilum]GJE26292.1 hypothetical protein LKMONMHP_1143 [Methylobacterium organophilum]